VCGFNVLRSHYYLRWIPLLPKVFFFVPSLDPPSHHSTIPSVVQHYMPTLLFCCHTCPLQPLLVIAAVPFYTTTGSVTIGPDIFVCYNTFIPITLFYSDSTFICGIPILQFLCIDYSGFVFCWIGSGFCIAPCVTRLLARGASWSRSV